MKIYTDPTNRQTREQYFQNDRLFYSCHSRAMSYNAGWYIACGKFYEWAQYRYAEGTDITMICKHQANHRYLLRRNYIHLGD